MSYSVHIGPNIRKSPYFDATVADGVTSFSVYNHMFIPGSFGDSNAEYDRLINGVAMWDVAAQRQVEIAGPDASGLVQHLCTRDVSGMRPGQGRYVALCDDTGAMINDPVLLKLAEDRFWLSIADSDVALWARAHGLAMALDVEVSEPDVSPMAIQGPNAKPLAVDLFGDWVGELKYFWFQEVMLQDIPLVVSRSGWSKQGGYEFYLRDASKATKLWNIVKEAGKRYEIGPGAPNDAERIESGLVSYGADCRRQMLPANPFEMGLGWVVDLDKPIDFVGRAALEQVKRDGAKRRRCGVYLDGPEIAPNPHQLDIWQNGRTVVGVLNECLHSPRLRKNIGVALVAADLAKNAEGLTVQHDSRDWPVVLTELPFL